MNKSITHDMDLCYIVLFYSLTRGMLHGLSVWKDRHTLTMHYQVHYYLRDYGTAPCLDLWFKTVINIVLSKIYVVKVPKVLVDILLNFMDKHFLEWI